MKSSTYNIFIPDTNGQTLVFNAYTKRYFWFSDKNISQLKNVIKNIDLYSCIPEYDILRDKLYNNGFVVDSSIEELSLIKGGFEHYRDSSEYVLLILTTYSCNFNCWYCTQKHKGVKIDADLERRIDAHIKKYIDTHKISSLKLSWFGGEPLQNYDFIRRFSVSTLEYCRNKNVTFSCSITTNGSLLTPSMIGEMASLGFNSFQITIDGNKAKHNATRYNNTITDSYSLILDNIITLCNIIPEAEIVLRVNYTKDNLSRDFAREIDEVLGEKRSQIKIFFRKVWQEDFTEDLNAYVGSVMRDMTRMGYKVMHDYDGGTSVTPCYAEKEHYNAIFPDGRVDKCSNRDMSDARGVLLDDGTIQWNEPLDEYRADIFADDSECRGCKYLPLCMGPCPKRREGMKQGAKIACIYDDKERVFASDIKNYVSIQEGLR